MASSQPLLPRVELKWDSIRIYFGDVLHLHLKLSQLVAIQSWRRGKNNYQIEYTMEGGATVLSEYDTEDKWRAVLSGLEQGVLRGT